MSDQQRLHELIDLFSEEWVGSRVGEARIRALRDPELAGLLCNIVATQFAEFLRSYGFDAESLSEDGDLSASPENFGYHDRKILGAEQHDATFVTLNDGTELVIDWTASQYGYESFPMIQEIRGEKWIRVHKPPALNDRSLSHKNVSSELSVSVDTANNFTGTRHSR